MRTLTTLGFSLLLAACAPTRGGRTADESQFASAASSCDRGDGRSCALVAVMLRNGVGVAADRSRAAAFSERSCNLGFAIGCNDLGVSYFDAWGVPRDRARAATLFESACERGAVIACINRATTSRDGEVDTFDARSFHTLASACDSGHTSDWLEWQPLSAPSSSACAIAGKMLLGRGTEADSKAARAWFAKGCRAGDTSACDDAKSPDGEACAFGCRGGVSHSSSCIAGICVADLGIGASCATAQSPCTRGSYCDDTRSCAAKKPIGGACKTIDECESHECQLGRCESAPMTPN